MRERQDCKREGGGFGNEMIKVCKGYILSVSGLMDWADTKV